jgi:curved DNA-binding protein CbpA
MPPELAALVSEKLALIDKGADHFAILGVTKTTPASQMQAAYFELAKKLHPDKLRAEGASSDRAETVFAVVNQAFAVLSNPAKRAEYERKLEKGDGDAEAEAAARRILAAEEAFVLGEMALKRGGWADAARDFGKAVELNPDEGVHHAYYAWATWCATSDKDAVAKEVRSGLRTAIRLSPKSADAYFFRGQIAKQQDQMDTAVDCFEKVLELDPKHHQAATELRLLRARSEKADKKGGLLGRLKR